MNILALDTTTRNASVSLMVNKDIYTKCINNEVTHSEKLLPLIDEILKEHNVNLKNIDLYACINGPGSFTGIRIGLSTLKAFSFVDKKSIFSINSTDLIAITSYLNSSFYKEKKQANIVSLIDAKNERVYYSVNNLSVIDDKIVISPILTTSNELIDDVLEKIEHNLTNTIFAGNIVNNYIDKISSKFSNITTSEFYPTTEDLIHAYLSINDTEKNMFNTYTLDANYARKTQAERLKDEK